MKTVLFLTMLLYGNLMLSQISLQAEIIEKGDKSDKLILEFTLKNKSNKNIVLPLDTTKLRFYDIYECNFTKFNLQTYPFLALSLKFHENPTGSKVVTDWGMGTPDSEPWPKDRFIDKKVHEYVFDNLIFMKSGEEIKFSMKSRLNYFQYDDLFPYFEYANLKSNTKYEVYFFYCAEMENTYSLLTKQQKKKLREYDFFTGTFESNKIKIISRIK